MEGIAVGLLLDILAAVIAWYFEIPIPGAHGGGKIPAEAYAGAAVMYSWFWIPVGYALTQKGEEE